MQNTWNSKGVTSRNRPVVCPYRRLGAFPIVTLSETRAKALANRRAVELGQARRKRREKAPAFAAAVDRVIPCMRRLGLVASLRPSDVPASAPTPTPSWEDCQSTLSQARTSWKF